MGRRRITAPAAAWPPDQHHTGHTRRRRARALAVVACAGIALAACGGDDDDAGTVAESAAAALQPGSGDVAIGEATAEDAADASVDADAPADVAARAGGIDLGAIGPDVIIEMQVSMSSDDIQRTVAAITARASALGGGVASSNVDYGVADDGAPSGFASLVVKVPPAAVEQLIGGLGDTGTVHALNQNAQDVTDQLVDLDVRIANARQSVTNVREFMSRTENLTELVTLESELTRRQTELEQLEAQQRSLSDRVALSTITIGIVPSTSAPQPETDDGIGDAFGDGWSAFVAVLVGLIVVLAVTAPFLAAAASIGAVGWWAVGRTRARAMRPRAADPRPDVGATVGEHREHRGVSEHDDVPTPTG